MTSAPSFWSSAWDVFLLFTVPIGGGIPAGVVLAQNRGFSWIIMLVIYFFSDVALACAFDPVMKLIIAYGKKSEKVAKFNSVLKQATMKTLERYGLNHGPFTLILIAFGVDPMTGRAATMMAGHGFITGWALAIAGDLLFFLVIMASTLWLNNVLGDGTMTAIIITVAMIAIPAIIRKFRERSNMNKIAASHILVEKEFEIKDIQKKLGEGATFEQLAQDFSKCPSGKRGGDLGEFARGMMVKPFDDAAFGLQPGQVSEPVQTQFGYHLIKRTK